MDCVRTTEVRHPSWAGRDVSASSHAMVLDACCLAALRETVPGCDSSQETRLARKQDWGLSASGISRFTADSVGRKEDPREEKKY